MTTNHYPIRFRSAGIDTLYLVLHCSLSFLFKLNTATATRTLKKYNRVRGGNVHDGVGRGDGAGAGAAGALL